MSDIKITAEEQPFWDGCFIAGLGQGYDVTWSASKAVSAVIERRKRQEPEQEDVVVSGMQARVLELNYITETIANLICEKTGEPLFESNMVNEVKKLFAQIPSEPGVFLPESEWLECVRVNNDELFYVRFSDIARVDEDGAHEGLFSMKSGCYRRVNKDTIDRIKKHLAEREAKDG